MNIKGIIIFIISRSVFDLLLIQLNKFNPKILYLIHKIPENWKGKWIFKWIAIIILLLISAIIMVYFRLNDSLGYIVGGFLMSLCEFAFKKPKEVSK